jgi:hypothetical protein
MAIIKVGMVYWARLPKGKREKKGDSTERKKSINQSTWKLEPLRDYKSKLKLPYFYH